MSRIPAETLAARREALARALRERGLPALLVTSAANRYWLTGFELFDTQCDETAGWVLATPDARAVVLTDPRYEEAAARAVGPEDTFIYRGKRLEALAAWLADACPRGLGFDPKGMSVFDHARLSEAVELTGASGLVERLRLTKDAAEIEAIRASTALNHRLFEALPGMLLPGVTEAEAAWAIERFFRDEGAQGMAFPSIVAVGANAALPHAEPGDTPIHEGELVLVDTGCRVNDYCSDQTRTFWIGGTPPKRFAAMLGQVKEAQRAALEALRPGLSYADAYRAARAVFERHGVAERFTHSLGHGIGLSTHEPPSLSHLATGELRAGMVVTVEPGLYYPDWGGARWEHMALITEDGCEVL